MGEIANRENISGFEANLDAENRNVIEANRRDQLSETFGNGVKLATEPITRTSQIAQNGITDVGKFITTYRFSSVPCFTGCCWSSGFKSCYKMR
jgi:hypothetical protein